MVSVLSPVGRIVWGHPSKLQPKKDPNTKQEVLKADGSKVLQCAFGVAFPKDQFSNVIWPVMDAEAKTGYPQGIPPKFAWKWVDGDGADSEGKPFNTREGYAGCYVLTYSSQTGFPPPVYKFNPQTGQYDQVPVDGIKTGDFVRVATNIVLNVPTVRTHTPGLYVNPDAVELVGYGTEIVNRPDAATLFGGQQAQLPPGASATPISSAPAQQPMPMQQPQPGQYQPQYNPQLPVGAPHVPQQQPYQPAPDFVQNAGMQQPYQPAPAPNQMMPAQQPMPMQQPQPGQYQPVMPGQMPPR